MVMIPEERAHELKAGMRAVDLGASPGGWLWVLAQRGIRVTAIDMVRWQRRQWRLK